MKKVTLYLCYANGDVKEEIKISVPNKDEGTEETKETRDFDKDPDWRRP